MFGRGFGNSSQTLVGADTIWIATGRVTFHEMLEMSPPSSLDSRTSVGSTALKTV